MTTTNYFNTFIHVADDCELSKSQVPPAKENPTIAQIQFEIISKNPYRFTSDDVLFAVYRTRNNIPENDVENEREKFFSKGQPCFRSSPLTKRYGWGIHSDKEGKIALVPIESSDYSDFVSDSNLKQIKAMRSKRK